MLQENVESFEDSGMVPRSFYQPASLIDSRILESTLGRYDVNNLFHFLTMHFGEQGAYSLINQFRIGTLPGWSDWCVFWQINTQGEIRSGKIVLLDPVTGKFSDFPDCKPILVHKAYNLAKFNLKPCLFGEHQLTSRPADTVGIVANEVTAIIATAFYPGYVWLASGKTIDLSLPQCQALAGRNVVLYPNLSDDGVSFNRWCRMADNFQKHLNCRIRVSRHLEDNASPVERAAGLDIGDFLIQDRNSEEIPFSKGDESNLVQQDEPVSVIASSVQPLNSVIAS